MANLTGNLKDVTNQAPSTVSSITVKAPGVRLGSGNDLIVSSPAGVNFNHDTGALTLTNMTGGLSWLVIEGTGWSDTVALSIADGMVSIVEAVANASGIPALADYINLLIGLQNRLDDIAIDAVNDALVNNSTDVIGSTGTTHANKYVQLDADGDLYISTDSIVKSSDPVNKNYVDTVKWVKRNILSDEDLNDLTDNGLYFIPLSNTMTSLLNRPFGSTGPGFVSVTNSDGTVIQELTNYSADGPITMSRTTLGGVFQDWVNPAVVTKPLLWGDMDDAVIEGDYAISTYSQARDLANRPPFGTIPAAARVSVRRAGGTRLIQSIVGIVTGGIGERWERNRNSTGAWESWTLVHTDISRAEVLDILGAIQTDHVVTVGDSQVGATYGWANLLADVSGQTVVNRGRSGNTPDEALLRTGGWRLPIEPVALTPGTRVSVSFDGDYPVLGRDFSHNGYVLGKSVSLWYTHSTGGWEALLNAEEEPLTLSEPTLWASNYADFAPEKLSRRIVWFGGNSIRTGRHRPGESLVEHVQKAYSRAIDAWGDTTIVCGYVPAYGDTVGRDSANELNTWLSHTVPTQFLDMRHRIQLAAPDILGRALTTSEFQDIANGYLPRPLYREDLVHLTDEAHVKIADIVAEFPHGATPQLSIRSNPAPVVSLSGTGSPEGSVTAAVGSTYTDTEATNGAIRWVKTSGTGNTGWRVEYGNTGVRNITSLIEGDQGSGTARIQRVGDTVMLSFINIPTPRDGSYMSIPNLIPVGFRSAFSWQYLATGKPSSIDAGGPLRIGTNGDLYIYRSSSETRINGTITYVSDTPWPTSLPGTPD